MYFLLFWLYSLPHRFHPFRMLVLILKANGVSNETPSSLILIHGLDYVQTLEKSLSITLSFLFNMLISRPLPSIMLKKQFNGLLFPIVYKFQQKKES